MYNTLLAKAQAENRPEVPLDIYVENEKVYNSAYHNMSAGDVVDALEDFKSHTLWGGFCLPFALINDRVIGKMRTTFGLAPDRLGLLRQADLGIALHERPLGQLEHYFPAIQKVVSRCELSLRGSTNYKETPMKNLEHQQEISRNGVRPVNNANDRYPDSLVPDRLIIPQERRKDMEFDQHSLDGKGVRHEVRFAFGPGSIHTHSDVVEAFRVFHDGVSARHHCVFAADLIQYIHNVSHLVSSIMQSFAARFVYAFEYTPDQLKTSNPVLVSIILAMIKLNDEYAYFIMGSVAPFHSSFWMSKYTICTDLFEQMRLTGRPFSDFFDWCPQLTPGSVTQTSSLWDYLPAMDLSRLVCPMLESPLNHRNCELFMMAKLWLDDAQLAKNKHNVQLDMLQQTYDDFLVKDLGKTKLGFDRLTTTITTRPPQRLMVHPAGPRAHVDNRENFIFVDEIRERFYATVHPSDPPLEQQDFIELAISCLTILAEEYCDHFTEAIHSPRGGRKITSELVGRFADIVGDMEEPNPLIYFNLSSWKSRSMTMGVFYKPPEESFCALMQRIFFADHPNALPQWVNSKLRIHLARTQPRFQLTDYADARFLNGLQIAKQQLFGNNQIVIHRIPKTGNSKITKTHLFWIFD
jgi:hypothetical protein